MSDQQLGHLEIIEIELAMIVVILFLIFLFGAGNSK